MAALGAEVAYEDNNAIGFGERNSETEDGHTYFSVFQSSFSAADPLRHWCFREYHSGYYAAFVLDPEGNKIEVVLHGAKA